MICYAMLCYAMLCYAMLCYAMPCYAMLCHAMLCYAMPCYAMLCHAMLRCAVLCCTGLRCATLCFDVLVVLCCAVLCCAVLCCAVLCSLHLNQTDCISACFKHCQPFLQAAQVRKSAFVPDWDAYNPDKHQSSTVYAGTNVQQVSLCRPLVLVSSDASAIWPLLIINCYTGCP